MWSQHSPWLPHSLQHFLPGSQHASELPLLTAELQLSEATWACTYRVFTCLGDGTLHVEVPSPSLLSLAMATTSLRT
ncbi:hypothetical protein XELAEV_18020052mg [Xenopus laevis]|uniref:Uncharacterized protein n=1 Tax=Xenopus laevis TaxID=8355 RepID=A0A974HQN4_XENLA|nr:hypothetical protein XELAEV_18020052mg [Xenopus laevis]